MFLVVNYRPAGSFLVEESAVGTAEVSGTEDLVPRRSVAASGPTANKVLRPARVETQRTIEPPERDGLALLLERQQRAKLPALYGLRTTTPDGKGDLVKIGILSIKAAKSSCCSQWSIRRPTRWRFCHPRSSWRAS